MKQVLFVLLSFSAAERLFLILKSFGVQRVLVSWLLASKCTIACGKTSNGCFEHVMQRRIFFKGQFKLTKSCFIRPDTCEKHKQVLYICEKKQKCVFHFIQLTFNTLDVCFLATEVRFCMLAPLVDAFRFVYSSMYWWVHSLRVLCTVHCDISATPRSPLLDCWGKLARAPCANGRHQESDQRELFFGGGCHSWVHAPKYPNGRRV